MLKPHVSHVFIRQPQKGTKMEIHFSKCGGDSSPLVQAPLGTYCPVKVFVVNLGDPFEA